jgi:hypothetical protein
VTSPLEHTTLAAALACAALLGACGDSNDEPQTTTAVETIGSGATCRARLQDVVTPAYLRAMGLAISNPDAARGQLTRAIRTVCRRGPSNLPLNQGGEQVVAIINQAAAPQEQAPAP